MKKLKKILSVLIILTTLIVMQESKIAFAVNNENVLETVEYSEEYLKWLELPDEEKENTLAPRMYDIQNTNVGTISTNPLKKAMNAAASVPSNYRLDTDGKLNIEIKNQGSTAYCWAFAAISTLETTLAKANPSKKSSYDYSERHMAYSTTRDFKNGRINEFGYNRNVASGGSWWTAEAYLTNGSGAKKEADMPFNESEELVDISDIEKGNVVTQVYDTINFPNYINIDGTLNENVMDQVKKHIQNYGAVFTGMHWNQDLVNTKCYNQSTGALYCNNEDSHQLNHAVSIIGWDNNYSRDNFLEGNRPQNDGAWIIRNSWGDQIGDNGFMYVSYEDVILSSSLYGITKAEDSISYDNIYQYNKFYPNKKMNTNNSVAWLCNVFDKNTTEKDEYLNQVSIFVPEKCKCQVYVNPGIKSTQSTGTSTTIITDNKDEFKGVDLKDSTDGKSKILDAGYHTLELDSQIKITSEKFAVAIKMEAVEGSTDNNVYIAIESSDDDCYKYVNTNEGQCFFSNSSDNFTTASWRDLGTISKLEQAPDSNSTIKAFTVLKEKEDNSLKEIKITNAPNKTEYYVGENFVKDGMNVTAYFNNNTSKVLSDIDYSIENGSDLKLEQKSVTIKYEGMSAIQAITVKEKQQDETKKDDTKQDDTQQDDKKQDETKKDDLQQDEEQNEQAQNSKLSNSKVEVQEVKAYYFTDRSNENYTLIDVKVNGITKNLNNDKLEYYYSLSSSKNDENINNWIRITENQNADDKLQFTIDSRNILNYNELEKSDVIYLYIKEVATKGGNQSVAISDAMKLETNKEVEIYENNIKKENSIKNSTDDNGINKTNINDSNMSKANKEKINDNTTATGKLPQTGAKVTVTIILIAVLGIGIFLYVRYKNLSKYVK